MSPHATARNGAVRTVSRGAEQRSSPFGEIDTAGDDLALPPPEQLARGNFELVIRRLADDIAFGSDNSRLLGSGLEYAGSRPYVPGDSVRLLNWRLSARTAKPYVREYEALKRTSIYIVVDTSASMTVTSVARSKHALSIWIASALALLAQRRMSPVAIVGGGERTAPVVPSLSRTDLQRALEPLRCARDHEPTRVGERVADIALRASRASVLVVLSDLHDPQAIPALRNASQRHDCLVLHTVDPTELAPLRAGFVRAREAESGRMSTMSPRGFFAREHDVRGELLRAGADYLRIRTDESFIPILRRFFATRGSLVRGRG